MNILDVFKLWLITRNMGLDTNVLKKGHNLNIVKVPVMGLVIHVRMLLTTCLQVSFEYQGNQ